MPENAVATLSSKGWVTDPEHKADKLLAYYFTTQYSQTILYAGQLSSLQYDIQRWGNNKLQIENKLSIAIENYLKGFFENASVSVTVQEQTSTVDGRMTVEVNARVTQGGVTYSVGSLVNFLNSTVVSIMSYNNTGTALPFS